MKIQSARFGVGQSGYYGVTFGARLFKHEYAVYCDVIDVCDIFIIKKNLQYGHAIFPQVDAMSR